MTLGTEVVDLIRLNLLNSTDQIGAVGEIAVMKSEPWVALMGVLVEVIDPAGVKRGSSPLDPVYLIALLQQEFSQITAVLPSNAGD